MYTPDLGLQICELIAEGETLKDICEQEGMPTRQTVHRWVIAFPEFGRAYAAARELSAYSMEEEALMTGRNTVRLAGQMTSQQVRAAEVHMNQLRWSAARRNAKVYSERAAVQVTVPIQINTTLDMGGAAGGGTVDHPNIYDLEAKDVTIQPAETIEIDSEERVRQMADTSLAPMAGPAAVPHKKQTKAQLRAEHFKKHGARGAARRTDVISGEDK